MPALDASKLESLIVDRICSLDYVVRAAYGDDGREVDILVFHDDIPARFEEMVMEISDRGMEIDGEIPDRLVVSTAIHDGPDLSEDALFGCKLVYVRDGRRRGRGEGRGRGRHVRPMSWRSPQPWAGGRQGHRRRTGRGTGTSGHEIMPIRAL